MPNFNFSDLWKRIKSGCNRIFQSRTTIVLAFFCILSVILVQRLFSLQIVNGQEYAENYKLQIQKTKDVEGTRGNIYDRNGKLLAYNELAYAVTIEDSGEYESRAVKNEELNEVIRSVIEIVESNGDSMINDFGIVLDEDEKYVFVAESETQKLRFIADIYGLTTIDQLTEEQRNATALDVITYLCTDETYGYGIDMDALSKEDVLKLVTIRYAISLNSYQKYIETTLAEDVSEETVASIMENTDSLEGVEISEQSIRRYNYSECMANVVGYTGKISTEEYQDLSKEDQERYDLTDTIGKAGIEKTMDSVLKGDKGSVKIYVNNVGKVIETVEEEEAGAGDDIYLTIDADLQQAAYDILEQELAGILLDNMVSSLTFDRTSVSDSSKVKIPAGDVYNAFISNNIVDMSHFSEEDAGENEQAVYASFSEYKSSVLNKLRETLLNEEGKSYQNLSLEWQAYLTYVVTDFLQNDCQVLLADEIDTNDETYISWHTDESINVYTYLTYAISQNWVDSSKLVDYLTEEGAYSDSSEIYQALVDYVIDQIQTNNGFDKLIYEYMIKSGTITGHQLCMILYEQGVLDTSDEQYQSLASGKLGAYDFVRAKIKNLEITPGQLALEPCSGSIVMTDVNTGDVLACVSYPGFDNNQLANSMDSTYYSQLVTDGSSPLYNKATQEKTAPGSTYKPMVAVAGLSEGVIDLDSYIECTGLFDVEDVGAEHKCWAYPSMHGSLNLSEAIEYSCNYYFYTVGYRLSIDRTTSSSGKETARYSSNLGTDTLRKYAEEFGLGEVSGVEIAESEPQISDESSVPSAIGQGTNNYTTTQLARYVTAVANEGTVYQLTLLDKITSPEGEVIESNEPKVTNQIDQISDEEWDAIHEGMRNVTLVSHSKIFTELNQGGLNVSGKTGTAQQSKTHPDHGLFIGYAPSDDPEVAFAVRIANGYSSSRAAEVGRDLMKYYYEFGDMEDVLTGTAASLTTETGVGD